MDSKLTNSRSQFLSRVHDDKLQFQLDAFRFAQETRSAVSKLIYALGAFSEDGGHLRSNQHFF